MKVLIVDDNPKLLELLARLLEKEGYEVVCARNGDEALSKYSEHSPDIVCLDILMPGISGFEVCRELKEKNAKLTIVMISSQSRPADVAKSRAMGASDFIVKPFDLSDVTDRMRRITQASIAKAHPELVEEHFEIGDLVVFPSHLQAERAGKKIQLNLRDLGILKLLHDLKGKAASPELLKPFCWSTWAPSEATAVGWYVSQLCKKIEVNPNAPALIRALPDGGYICTSEESAV